ncbi:MAG: hypothetical protein HON70_43815, partial [Lentisphaerae bacterium]|nr:hypothetical protein [Lentisphaerota bacterium]
LESDFQSRFVSLALPPALVRTMTVELPDGWQLTDSPGLHAGNNVFHLALERQTRVRFSIPSSGRNTRAVEIDILSQIDLRGGAILIETTFEPAGPLAGQLTIAGPSGARILKTSLPRPWLKETEDATLVAALPEPLVEPFTIQYLLTPPNPGGLIAFDLPTVPDNNGREGLFMITPPVGAEITVTGDGLERDLPVTTLSARLKTAATGSSSYDQLPSGGTLTIEYTSVVEIDTLSRVDLRGGAILIETTFEPVGPLAGQLTIAGPSGARILKTSLPPPWVKETESATLVATLPEPWGDPFTIQYLLTPPNPGGQITFDLPTVPDNRSREGLLVITPPAGVEVTVTGDGLVRDLPITTLSPRMKAAATGNSSYDQLPSEGTLTIEYTSVVEIDILSQIGLRSTAILIETTFEPVGPLAGQLTIAGPSGARILKTSLPRPWVKETKDAMLVATLPEPLGDPFTIQYLLTRPDLDAEATFKLPTISGNSGREGLFVVAPPPGMEILATGEGLTRDVPAAGLGDRLQAVIADRSAYDHLPYGSGLTLKFQRLDTVSRPSIVLDTITLFASFEESGGCLSVLRMSVPAEAGRYLRVERPEQTEIWALSVNGRSEKVYTDDEHHNWVIPLASGHVSDVELAYLSQGEKLGLHGRLAVHVPRTGLSAKKIRVGIGLPKRIELISIEGPVSPDRASGEELPRNFAGVPHLFTRSFHKGEAFDLALFYKEPAK